MLLETAAVADLVGIDHNKEFNDVVTPSGAQWRRTGYQN